MKSDENQNFHKIQTMENLTKTRTQEMQNDNYIFTMTTSFLFGLSNTQPCKAIPSEMSLSVVLTIRWKMS